MDREEEQIDWDEIKRDYLVHLGVGDKFLLGYFIRQRKMNREEVLIELDFSSEVLRQILDYKKFPSTNI